MQLLEVYTPEIETYVRYKIIDPEDVEALVEASEVVEKDEYVRLVLEAVVFNLKSEVTDVLRLLKKEKALSVLQSIYTGCVMLNPGLDVDEWLRISSTARERAEKKPKNASPAMDELPPSLSEPEERTRTRKRNDAIITKARFLGLEPYLRDSVIGQDEAISAVVNSLKRTVVGLGDDQRPLGAFLFAGASGVGKTELAKQLHTYLYGDEYDIVRIDCGEFQHKHENQKLIGSPPGYIGHDDGGILTNQMEKNPNTVLLLDEVEKAHPDLWNTFLRVFDEGMITDSSGKEISFRNAIIIMTTNLGNTEAVQDILGGGPGFGRKIDVDLSDADIPPRERVEKHTQKAIRKHFRPEFLNRIDRVVVFNHLRSEDMRAIAALELDRLEAKLGKRGISLTYSPEVLDEMIKEGVNPVEGARGLARVRREKIEDAISDVLLTSSRWAKGTIIQLAWGSNKYQVTAKRPSRKKKAEEKA